MSITHIGKIGGCLNAPVMSWDIALKMVSRAKNW